MGNTYITRNWYVPYWPSIREGAAHLRDEVKDGERQHDVNVAGFARPFHGTTPQVEPAATDRKNMLLITENSMYELDVHAKRIRRLTSTHPPTPRQGEDGEWKTYESLTPNTPEIGVSIFIDWTGHANGTLTSMITEVIRP